MNFSHSWVPFGMKLNVSPINITFNHEQIVLFGVVTNKDPPGWKKKYIILVSINILSVVTA